MFESILDRPTIVVNATTSAVPVAEVENVAFAVAVSDAVPGMDAAAGCVLFPATVRVETPVTAALNKCVPTNLAVADIVADAEIADAISGTLLVAVLLLAAACMLADTLRSAIGVVATEADAEIEPAALTAKRAAAVVELVADQLAPAVIAGFVFPTREADADIAACAIFISTAAELVVAAP